MFPRAEQSTASLFNRGLLAKFKYLTLVKILSNATVSYCNSTAINLKRGSQRG